MPYPQNLETGTEIENIVRSHGAIPATIAIMNGKIHIGLTPSQLRELAATGKNAIKTSRRDLAYPNVFQIIFILPDMFFLPNKLELQRIIVSLFHTF